MAVNGIFQQVSRTIVLLWCFYFHQTNSLSFPMRRAQLKSPVLPADTKVTVIGSGNWGTAVARRVALNLVDNSHMKEKQVKMWVFEETVEGRKLSEIINQDHINPKYLPNVKLPSNLVACPELHAACADADVLLFVLPHKFLPGVLSSLKGHVKPNAIAVSFSKGIQFSDEGPVLLTDTIRDSLQLSEIVAVMGANVAKDVACDAFVETTVASVDINSARKVASLLQSPVFQTQVTTDLSTVEMCGALKNVIALASGFCDGLGLAVSSKAALIRQGAQEIGEFCRIFDRTGNFKADTMMLSCGVADLIATCFGGRNARCGKEFVLRRAATQGSADRNGSSESKDSMCSGSDGSSEALSQLWSQIEADVLCGQKLEGVGACREAIQCLRATGNLDRPDQFPLLRRIHGIAFEGEPFDQLFKWA